VTREQLIAAEIFGYSFDNYADHLEIGHVRYEEMMPKTVRTLERAATEGWPSSKVAALLEIDIEDANELIAAFDQARQVVDAENPAEMFRNAVRFSIQNAVEEGVADSESIEKLVTQICYRAADLGFILKAKGERLSRYSEHLRKEPDVEYGEGYFDEETDSATISAISPFFIVADVPATLAFYRDMLGFEVKFRGPTLDDEFFGIVRRDGAMIMFKALGEIVNGKEVLVEPVPNYKRKPAFSWDAYVEVSDPDALAAEFESRGVRFSVPLRNDHDGLRGFVIEDIDGYGLFFGHVRE
jgi:catechol 2,3-dioxygenase-like lactoylglutathione lyase family enzyme